MLLIPGLWIAGFVLFIPLLKNRFIGDDYTALSIFTHYRAEPFFRTVLYAGNDFFRPLNMALIMARGAVFGSNPLYYVIANVIMHLANTTLVFLVARRLFKNTLATLAAAALFLAAFSHYEAITWISGSITLFVTFFVLVSLYGHVSYRQTEKRGWTLLALAGFILAFLTKETAIALPFIMLACDLLLVPGKKKKPEFFLPYFGYVILLGFYLVVQTGWALRFAGGDSTYRLGWHVLSNIADYWVWLVMPNPRHPYVAGALAALPRPLLWAYWSVAGAAALTLPLVIVLAVLKKLKHELLWCFLAALAALLVFLPFAVKISARYAYLPSVFMSLFAGGVFAGAWNRLKERRHKPWRWVLGAVLGLYLAGNSVGLVLIEREFVRVSTLTERLAIEVGELVKLADEDVVFIDGLPAHVHLREAVHWLSNPEAEVLASNDAYRGTPKTLEVARCLYKNRGGTLYYMRFEEGKLGLVSSESLSPPRE